MRVSKCLLLAALASMAVCSHSLGVQRLSGTSLGVALIPEICRLPLQLMGLEKADAPELDTSGQYALPIAVVSHGGAPSR